MSNAQQLQQVLTRGDRFHQARRMSGLSVAAMALKIGVSRNVPTRIEGNQTPPSVDALMVYADVSGLSPRWLATGEGEPLDPENVQIRSRCFYPPDQGFSLVLAA